ncbi:MAG TPA: carboxylating nicotinate-nucleotide diphosphorylase, partial [Candidatus Baltobacteraceae bacterium]|nr:carboxylating nicotinate-nucleotide diphosphorylase [Candidatus Baltobacteraceae bacterium]
MIRTALLEDLAHGNDVTTDAIVPDDAQSTAHVVAREPGVVAGLDAALLVFELLDPGAITFDIRINDGEAVHKGDTIVSISGRARTLLTGERTMLNLLCRVSGIASATRKLVDLVAGTGAHVIDTRKTTPGLRALEKYAVRCGGGSNHRFGLDDAILIKDNHLALAGS